MKKILILLCAILTLLCMSGIATAAYVFDFEDGTDICGPLDGLEAYMEAEFDNNDIKIKQAIWLGEYDGNSDIITMRKKAVFDFDPSPSKASNFEIQALSFDWLVLDTTKGIDIGLDVFDDFSNKWIKNYEYSDGLLTFADELEITRLRIHSDKKFGAGIDNLTLHVVPIPGTVWIFGAGLISLLGVRRKFKKETSYNK